MIYQKNIRLKSELNILNDVNLYDTACNLLCTGVNK
jgi:hypothetical protein